MSTLLQQAVGGAIGISLGCTILALRYHWRKRKQRRAWELELHEMFHELDRATIQLLRRYVR